MRGKRCCTFPCFNTGIGIGIVETSCSRRTNCQCMQYALGTSAKQARQRSLKQLECHARSTTAVLNAQSQPSQQETEDEPPLIVCPQITGRSYNHLHVECCFK